MENKKGVWKEQKEHVTINFSNGNLYIYGKAWGLAGNHEEIVISPTKLESYEELKKDEVYIFYSRDIYYKSNENELVVYATESQIKEPIKFDSQVKITLKRLKTHDEIKKYSENYQKYGLPVSAKAQQIGLDYGSALYFVEKVLAPTGINKQ